MKTSCVFLVIFKAVWEHPKPPKPSPVPLCFDVLVVLTVGKPCKRSIWGEGASSNGGETMLECCRKERWGGRTGLSRAYGNGRTWGVSKANLANMPQAELQHRPSVSRLHRPLPPHFSCVFGKLANILLRPEVKDLQSLVRLPRDSGG